MDARCSEISWKRRALFLLSILCAMLGITTKQLVQSERKQGGLPGWMTLASFGVVWFFVTLSVESSIIAIVDVIFEHRLYLPMAGVALTASALMLTALDRLTGPRSITHALIPTLIVAILVVCTFSRNKVWASGELLWADAAAKSPNEARPHIGAKLEKNGKLAEAIALKPDYAEAHNNLAVAMSKKGDRLAAARFDREAIRLRADYAKPHNNLGNIYLAEGRIDDAIAQYHQALDIRPDNPEPVNNLESAYVKMGMYERALPFFEQAAALMPDNPVAEKISMQ